MFKGVFFGYGGYNLLHVPNVNVPEYKFAFLLLHTAKKKKLFWKDKLA